jgi:signal transduction histidine kinase
MVLALGEGVKWMLWRLWDAEVIFVGLAMPTFLIFYYRGLLAGALATLVFVFCEYWLFERPQGYAWYSLRFLSLASLILVAVPVIAYFATRWRRELSEARENTRKLAAAAKYRDLLLGSLSHDLRSPLMVIKNRGELLRQKGVSPEDVVPIDRACRRILKMIDQVVEMARMHLGGGIQLNLVHTDLVALIKHVIDEMLSIYPRASIHFHCERPKVEGVWDETRLERGVSNLLSNACKYGDTQQPVTVSLSDENDQVSITVHNEGEPIPQELIPRLFDPFKRGEKAHKQASGLGLGLYITADMIDKHGGSIVVRSSREDGTEFRVVLPRRRARAEELGYELTPVKA